MDTAEQKKEGKLKLRVLANLGSALPLAWAIADRLIMSTDLILLFLFGLLAGRMASSLMVDGSGGARNIWVGMGLLFGVILGWHAFLRFAVINEEYLMGVFFMLSAIAVWIICGIALSDKDIKAYMPARRPFDEEEKLEELIDDIGK